MPDVGIPCDGAVILVMGIATVTAFPRNDAKKSGDCHGTPCLAMTSRRSLLSCLSFRATNGSVGIYRISLDCHRRLRRLRNDKED